MKATGILFSFACTVMLACSFTTVRIGTYNLWRSDIGKDEYAWPERRDILAKSIVENAFDIFAAEEVDTTMFRELPSLVAQAGGNYEWLTFSPYAADGSGSMKAQALVFRKDRFAVETFHHFWASETPDVMSTGWDEGKFKRGACCAVLKDLQNGQRIFVMVSHFPLGKEARLHFAPIVIEKEKQYNPEGLPSFFIGDLNTRQERPESEILRSWWTDSYMALPQENRVGPQGTFNSHDVTKDMETAPRIDFVYFRGAGVTPVKYVVNTKKYGGIYPSDHCPVYVDFNIAEARPFILSNDNVSVTISPDGSLLSLKNVRTGHDYAGGEYLWRMYYDAPYEKEIQIVGGEQRPLASMEGNVITLRYPYLRAHGKTLAMSVTLKVILESDKVRFVSELTNDEEHTVIREMQYPLVRAAVLPSDHKLYTSEAGGQLFDSPLKAINKLSSSPYKKPEQYFRQKDVKYGAKVFMNCFGLFGDSQGLYFGSHDATFQDTWHGLRAYRNDDGKYSKLEFGFFKYPHCFCGEKWACDANVVAPYSGTWYVASRIYRDWVNSWWDHRATPQWVREMKSWQRVIFKHQYGEYFFRYPDMNGKVDAAGQSVGCNALFLFGWWAEGMDHGNPDYSPDMTQGGDAALKAEIAKYQARGNNLILYYNGKLIDRESRFYKSGMGPKVCRHDNTGSEILERYKFTGQGTWLGEYDQRTFAVATMMDPTWNEVLFSLQDRAYGLGARSVFFDQLGYIEKESANWDNSREYPVPDVYGIRKRAECLKLLRDRYAEIAPDFALGAEGTVDALCQYCDYTHGYPNNDGPERWINFFRYTFPEIVFTERGLRDDEDVPRRVNNSVLDGQRNDIEIWRCRGIISDTPVYQAYLAQANALKEKYKDCLMLGTYNDVLGFTCSNSAVDARSFLGKDRMAIVAANQNTDCARTLTASFKVPGYHFVEAGTTGGAVVKNGKIKLGQYDLAVLIYEKD